MQLQVKSPFPGEPDAQGLRRLEAALGSLRAGAQPLLTREGPPCAARRKSAGRQSKAAPQTQTNCVLEEIYVFDECIYFPNLVAIN